MTQAAGFRERPSLKDCYRILGLAPGAAEKEIRAAFRKLSLRHHPDRAGETQANNDKFAEIRDAYEDVLDYIAEPRRGRWVPPPPGKPAPKEGGYPDAGPSRGGYGRSGFSGSPPPGSEYGGRGGFGGRGYSFMDAPEFEEWFDEASQFTSRAKGRFSRESNDSRRPRGGFGSHGCPPGGNNNFSRSMPRGQWSNFSQPGNPPGRHEDYNSFSGGGSRRGGRARRNSYRGYGGDYDNGASSSIPSRDDPAGVMQWSLRKAHGRLAPLPGKLAKMRDWWNRVGACGELSARQRGLGDERFDRAELHLAKVLSRVTEAMDAVRKHQQQQDRRPDANWYSKGSGSHDQKTKMDKWTRTAMQLGRDSEALMGELVSLEISAAHDDVVGFLTALGEIGLSGGSDLDGDSSEDYVSSEESSAEYSSSSESY
ncbi:uncharacterized protein PG998_015226 [Apiospora kogelbergensis]|uniref:uncharacterized protein n=1 Tax=Apiospora kogelbergensis TaxID=1337665 RepID=UPI003130FE48